MKGDKYIITCPNVYIAKKLFDEFISIAKNNDDIAKCVYLKRMVTLRNGNKYTFISFYDKQKYTLGFRGKIISCTEFEDMMKNFQSKGDKYE